MSIAEIIKELEDKNRQVFLLKEFAKQVVSLAEKNVTIEDIRTAIKIYKPKEIFENLEK